MGKRGGKKKPEKVDWTAVIDQAWGSDSETAVPNGCSASSECSPGEAVPVELAGCGSMNVKEAAVSDLLAAAPEVREHGQPLGKEDRESSSEKETGTRNKAGTRGSTPATRALETPRMSVGAECLSETSGRKSGCDCTDRQSSLTAETAQEDTLCSGNSVGDKLLPEDPLNPLPDMPTDLPAGAITRSKSTGITRTDTDKGHVSMSEEREMQSAADSDRNISDILSYVDIFPHSCLSQPMGPICSSDTVGSQTPSNPPNVTSRKIPRKLFPIFNAQVEPPTSSKVTAVGKQTQRENR